MDTSVPRERRRGCMVALAVSVVLVWAIVNLIAPHYSRDSFTGPGVIDRPWGGFRWIMTGSEEMRGWFGEYRSGPPYELVLVFLLPKNGPAAERIEVQSVSAVGEEGNVVYWTEDSPLKNTLHITSKGDKDTYGVLWYSGVHLPPSDITLRIVLRVHGLPGVEEDTLIVPLTHHFSRKREMQAV